LPDLVLSKSVLQLGSSDRSQRAGRLELTDQDERAAVGEVECPPSAGKLPSRRTRSRLMARVRSAARSAR
jgi:hypothetical protein